MKFDDIWREDMLNMQGKFSYLMQQNEGNMHFSHFCMAMKNFILKKKYPSFSAISFFIAGLDLHSET